MIPNVSLQRLGKGRLEDPGTDLLAAGGERIHVVAIECAEALVDAPLEIVCADEFAERRRGRGKPSGHADAGGREPRDHLAERGVLAADFREILEAQVLKPR